ncbi:PepSY domain-containing protein [Flavihumibacter sp. ZG627]|uniref:PepSY-associated TM helix domain-containing protein n=1 Tax=Flavihumibacter sp. ZG627 TaxID=1463156 RepID=UPI000693A5EA|nr:PepSY-associated TM helix domain-containing protein [Flavihumibacter sp. ZG627]
MKIFFRRIHLYLSLAAGLIIMVTCFTGAVLVFEKELQQFFHRERYFVEIPSGSTQVAVAKMVEMVEKQVPGADISSVKIYTDPSRTAELNYTVEKGQRRTAFVNPYSARIIEMYSYQETFFYTMFALHRWMLGGNIGKMIVGVSTIIFLFILITGIVLWWPKTRAILRQRLRIKLDAGWKRVNHDLHIVVGFYSAILLFVFAFTGLAWSFEWFNKGIYKVTGSPMQGAKPPVNEFREGVNMAGFDKVLSSAKIAAADVEFYNISAPKDSVASYAVNVLPNDAAHESATDNYYFDRYGASVNTVVRWEDRNLGQRVRATFKPVHVSSIIGMPSKIIGFIICLLGTSFPVTGFIMWLNRTRKKKKQPGMLAADMGEQEEAA